MAKDDKKAPKKAKPKKTLAELEERAAKLRKRLARTESKIAVSKGLVPGQSPLATKFPSLPEVAGGAFRFSRCRGEIRRPP